MVSKVRDFLMDEGFIEYVLGVSSKLVSQWEAYFKIHPEYMAAVEEAKAVLLAPADVDCEFSEDEYDDLKDSLNSNRQCNSVEFIVS